MLTIHQPLAFTVVNNTLQWNNETFYNGTAGFCQNANGDVFATFVADPGLTGCSPIKLVVYAGGLLMLCETLHEFWYILIVKFQ
jgi:hypothetical protein